MHFPWLKKNIRKPKEARPPLPVLPQTPAASLSPPQEPAQKTPHLRSLDALRRKLAGLSSLEIKFPWKKPHESNGSSEGTLSQQARRYDSIRNRVPRYARTSRFTLLIGDEGAILIHMKGNRVLSRHFVPDASPANLAELKETIDTDRRAPITVIIDSIDQSYVQQTLPPVSSFSVRKLIKRRLERDFKTTDIKGAVTLGKDKGGRKDWHFLMVSVEKSPQLVLWFDFIMGFDNRFRGIVLLSVEATHFVRNIERALGMMKANAGSEWKILISHNKVGGFRQIILRNGRLIFTRLALPIGEPTPELTAGHIEQEAISTIEYLKRFGYSPRAGLDMYLIASEEVCKLVDSKRFDANAYHAYPPHVLAQMLGIEGATQPKDQFGDVVLAASIGSIRRNTLKLATSESQLYDRYQMAKLGQRLFGTFALLGMLVYVAYLGSRILVVDGEIDDARLRQRVAQQALTGVKEQISKTGIDLDKVSDQIDIYSQIKSEARSPVWVVDRLSQVIRYPIVLKSLEWRISTQFPLDRVVPTLVNFNLGGAAEGQPAKPGSGTLSVPSLSADSKGEPVTLLLRIDFPPGLKSPALFKKFAEDFLRELHSVFRGYSMAYVSVPPEYLDLKSLQMSFDQRPSENNLGSGPVQVEIALYGKMPVLMRTEAAP